MRETAVALGSHETVCRRNDGGYNTRGDDQCSFGVQYFLRDSVRKDNAEDDADGVDMADVNVRVDGDMDPWHKYVVGEGIDVDGGDPKEPASGVLRMDVGTRTMNPAYFH